MNGDWQGIALIVGALIGGGGIGGFANLRRKRGSGDRENSLIDQLQEERERDHARIDAIERRERIRDDYIMVLRQHIADGKPPPPPPFPSGLTEGSA